MQTNRSDNRLVLLFARLLVLTIALKLLNFNSKNSQKRPRKRSPSQNLVLNAAFKFKVGIDERCLNKSNLRGLTLLDKVINSANKADSLITINKSLGSAGECWKESLSKPSEALDNSPFMGSSRGLKGLDSSNFEGRDKQILSNPSNSPDYTV